MFSSLSLHKISRIWSTLAIYQLDTGLKRPERDDNSGILQVGIHNVNTKRQRIPNVNETVKAA